MIRSVLARAAFVAIGAAAAGLVISWRTPTEPVSDEHGAPRSQRTNTSAFSSVGDGVARAADIERRLKRLEAAFAESAAERHRLAEQLDAIAAQFAKGGHEANDTARAPASSAPAAAPQAPANAAANAVASDDGKSPMERALVAAGLDAATVADIKSRQDGLTMAEIYLRDHATREQWLDSPRFAAEMAAIDAQRTPLRTEIGDDAYDRYLFALGQTNRVRIDDVMLQSPAAQAGLQAGDLIVRYGDARLFTPTELVNETRSGMAGEAVQLEIVRNGERLAVEVPRGPLGVRVAATQGTPEAS